MVNENAHIQQEVNDYLDRLSFLLKLNPEITAINVNGIGVPVKDAIEQIKNKLKSLTSRKLI